jgi:hypothetical protein
MNKNTVLFLLFISSIYSITAIADNQTYGEVGATFYYTEENYDNGVVKETDIISLTGIYLERDLSDNLLFLTDFAIGNGNYFNDSFTNDLEYEVFTFNFGGEVNHEFNNFLEIMLTFYYRVRQYQINNDSFVKKGFMASPSLLFKIDEHVSVSTGISHGVTGDFLNTDIAQNAEIHLENNHYKARFGASFTIDTYSTFFSIGMKF